MIFQQVVVRARNGNLVGKSPHHDTGVVVILRDQLLHLADGIGATARHMTGDIGNLRPDDKTLFVAQIVEILVVLVVRQTNGGRPHLHDEVNILLVMLGQQRVTHAPSVLVTGHAAQGILLTVQDKAVFGVNFKGATAKARANGVNLLPALHEARLAAVQVGVAAAVPEMHVGNLQGHLGLGAFNGCNRVFLFVVKGIGNRLPLLGAREVDLYLQPGVLSLNRRGHLDAGATVVIQVKVGACNANKVDVPIKAAVEGEVRHLGIYGFVRRIVHRDAEERFVGQPLGDIHAPGGIAAVVVCELHSVKIHVCRGVGTAEFKIILLCLGQLAPAEQLGIQAGAAEVIVSAVKAVLGVPGVGERHALPIGGKCLGQGAVVLGKQPALSQIHYLSHCVSPFINAVPDLWPSTAKR